VPDRGSVRRLAGRSSGARAWRCGQRAAGRGVPDDRRAREADRFARSAIPHGSRRPATQPSTPSCGNTDTAAGTGPPLSLHAAGGDALGMARRAARPAPPGSPTASLTGRSGPAPLRRGRPPEPPRSGSEGSSRRRTPTAAGSGRPRDRVPRTPRRADRLRARVGPGLDRLTPAERGHRAEQDRRSRPASAARLERPGPAPVAGWAAGRSVPSQRSDAPSERVAPRLAPERQRDERLEARWRAWRSARARIVSVGLAWPPLGKVELPASQRLATP